MMEPILDEDVQLMLKFKQGDRLSFEALLDKYQSPIINFIYRFLGDRIEAEDLAQEVFLRLYRAAKTYRPEAKFSTWIYRIAKNLVLNELRRRRHHQASSLEEEISGEKRDFKKQIPDTNTPSVSAQLEKHDLAKAVKEAINSLPDNQKTAVILKRYEGLSYAEIARIIGCSVSAVKSLLNRAKVGLKMSLEPYVKGK